MYSTKRHCYLHIGTHKTGSTSVQQSLSLHRRRIGEVGYLYPLLGRPDMAPHGHHNLAWEITSDHRYRPERGGLSAVLEEIGDNDRHVVLSSEDFEISAYQTERFESFVRRLKGCGLDVVMVIYFRNQIDYARSLYLALVGWGLDRTFREFIDEIVECGRLRLRDWIYSFDYDDFVQRLRGIEGVKVIVRSYDPLANGAVVADFLSVIGVDIGDLRLDESVRANPHRSVAVALNLFFRNRVGRNPTAAELNVLASLAPPETMRFDMSTAIRRRLVERFEASNEQLRRRLGRPVIHGMNAEGPGSNTDARALLDDYFCDDLIGTVRERAG